MGRIAAGIVMGVIGLGAGHLVADHNSYFEHRIEAPTIVTDPNQPITFLTPEQLAAHQANMDAYQTAVDTDKNRADWIVRSLGAVAGLACGLAFGGTSRNRGDGSGRSGYDDSDLLLTMATINMITSINSIDSSGGSC